MARLFLGYPFTLPDVRSTVEAAADGLAEVTVASDRLRGMPLLHKIEEMMAEADACLFDLTLHNPNVALELGIAHGRGYHYAVLYCTDQRLNPSPGRESSLFSDLQGWDSIRYSDLADLRKKLAFYLPEFIQNQSRRNASLPSGALTDAMLLKKSGTISVISHDRTEP
ncbi:MAG: hypothetical protein M3N13_02715 [Candidatus Eremiobacteraeota bacterium]|nr:hypothetical protein [Candidatus Eremiobacteraeota bacterium]